MVKERKDEKEFIKYGDWELVNKSEASEDYSD
jgi:hypothetical protein